MTFYQDNNVSTDKMQNDYFLGYYNSHIKEQLEEVANLPCDLSKYMIENFVEPYFSSVELTVKQAKEIKKLPDHVTCVYLVGDGHVEIPECVLNSKAIMLNCSFTEVFKFPKHKFFEQLVYLSCSFTVVEQLPSNLFNCIVIDARQSLLKSLPPRNSLKKLRMLNLWNIKGLSSGRNAKQIQRDIKHLYSHVIDIIF